jgi:hypothetical protein
MFTIVTNSLFCSAPKVADGITAYQRETVQNIATAIDTILGFGLIAAGFGFNMPILYLVGACQIWPFFAFVTVTLLACKEGKLRDPVYVRFRPCFPRAGN